MISYPKNSHLLGAPKGVAAWRAQICLQSQLSHCRPSTRRPSQRKHQLLAASAVVSLVAVVVRLSAMTYRLLCGIYGIPNKKTKTNFNQLLAQGLACGQTASPVLKTELDASK